MKRVKCIACDGVGGYVTEIFGIRLMSQCTACKGLGHMYRWSDDDDDDDWLRDRIQSVFG